MRKHSTILIVDDSPTYSAVLQNVLETRGFEVFMANGADKMWAVLEKEEVDTVVLDCEMPEEDGISIIRKLRANSKYSNLPVIMNTGHQKQELLHTALYLGCNDFVYKADGPEYIAEAVQNIPTQKHLEEQEPVRLLMVDDNEHFLNSAEYLLKRKGYLVVSVQTGEEALKILEEQTIDIILADWEMPHMSGIDLVKEIQTLYPLSPFTYVILSGRCGDRSTKEALQAGADRLICKADGMETLLEHIKAIIRNQNRNSHVIKSLFDIHNRAERIIKKRNRELEKEQQQTEQIIQSMNEILLVMDHTGVIVKVNQAAVDILEYKEHEFLSLSFSELIGDAKLVSEHESFECKMYKKNGESIQALLSMSFIHDKDNHMTGQVIVAKDMTEYCKMQDKVAQVSKLTSLGELSASIAHELNSPLSIIKMSAVDVYEIIEDSEILEDEEFMEENDHELEEAPGLLNRITKQVDRADRIISHLRTFGQEAELSYQSIHLNEIIENAMILLNKSLQHAYIELVNNVSDNLPMLNVDGFQIEEVLINLFQNSVLALSSVEKAEITIDAEELTEEKMIQIRFKDNGCGMSEEIKNRIFDPFFSTRPRGQGTGLGLSVSHGIITSHKGTIQCGSKENEGTTFIIQLPYSR